ncbi:ROK family protein [Demequina sp.]|uniref:ROK family protein n=1 Tax=Demequina sp. TaxID=2050685 RepID=UPI003A8967B7
MSGVRIGVDVGGTKIDAVVLDGSGAVLARHRLAVGKGEHGVVATTVEAVESACADAGISVGDAASIGIGIPGSVSSGVVRHAFNLGVTELDLAGALGTRWSVPVYVENDVNAAALGAWHLLGGGHASAAYLNLGTGLAAGIVLDGRVWRGAGGVAGEIGYISVDPHGPIGPDGLPGGLETYASGSGLALQWGRDGETGETVMDRARAGDPEAAVLRDNLMFGLASAVRVLVLSLDPDHIFLGGGLTALGEELTGGARAVIDEWEAASPFLASLRMNERMSIVPADQPVAAMGAAMLEANHG